MTESLIKNTPTEGEDKEIQQFLEGRNPKKYVVAVETRYDSNIANLIIHNPETNEKKIETQEFKPFVFIKDFKKNGLKFFNGDENAKRDAIAKYKIKFKSLRVTDNNKAVVERLNNGYKFLVYTESTHGYSAIQNFFREGGIDIWTKNKINAKFNLPKEIVKTKHNLYTKIDVQDGVELMFNNLLERYEFHFNSRFVNTFVGKNEDDDLTFVTIKNGKESLEFGKNFDIINYRKRGKYVIPVPPNVVDTTAEEEGREPHKPYYSYKTLDISYKISYSDFFHSVKPDEQFMISSGIRLFKGYENYSELDKLIYDLETTGLNPKVDRIFKVGIRNTKGVEHVFTNDNMNDDDERRIIINFFKAYVKLKPAIIYGYNSENFDWDFVFERCEQLGIEVDKLRTTISPDYKIKRKEGATVKFGGDTEYYTQTIIWGTSVIDILHATRRTQAINSDLKEGGLKYVCKFESIAKPNRVYIEGDQIFKMWQDNLTYVVDKETNQYFPLPKDTDTTNLTPNEAYNQYVKFPRELYNLNKLTQGVEECVYKENVHTPIFNEVYDEHRKFFESFYREYVYKTGAELVDQYLVDDLWETQQVDERYNEDRFMLAKYLPCSFNRTCTMGGASTWNLIMTAWSYENSLAIPYRLEKKSFTGGLSRTFMLGFFKNIYKFDFSGLYPSIQLEHEVFPVCDVTGVLKRLLSYFKTTRDKFKFLAGDNSPLPKIERKPFKAKQLPLKILNNSNFGANGSSYFNWADFDCAERITCTGRLYLRNMVQFFMKWSCIPTVCDTDGINMAVPEMIGLDINLNKLPTLMPIDEALIYESKGKTFTGSDALVEKYNQEILGGGKYMKLDNDGMWVSAINVSRKNYANFEPDGKIKYVGNTLKSKTMPEYIKEFVDNGIELILKDKPKEFIEYYYEYLTKIYLKQIPLKKIASKSRVRLLPEDYVNRGTDKNGKEKGKQAHMELVVAAGLKVNLGDVIYYVNNGTAKSHGDVTTDKEGKLRSYMIDRMELENNPNKTGDYNVAKYVEAFNKRVEALITPFKDVVKSNLIVSNPAKRNYYTDHEMELHCFDNPNPQDNIGNFFILAESEVKYWNRMGINPKGILEEFTTEIPIDVEEYNEKVGKVKTVLNAKGITVKAQYESYNENDSVVTFERNFFALNKENEEKIKIPKELNEFFDSNSDTVPLNEEDYQGFIKYKNLFGEETIIKEEKEFFLNFVEEGYLKLVKQI